MITTEQKELCITLYTEGSHTIKDIISQTGLKYAPEVYQILDEAGIQRKRKHAAKNKESKSITIEESRLKYFKGMCRLYQGENENPFSGNEDDFRRYMWRNEWKIIDNLQDPEFIRKNNLDNPISWSPFFISRIKSYIELWTNREKGERPTQWLSKYYSYKPTKMLSE